jgi:hypothetical protein
MTLKGDLLKRETANFHAVISDSDLERFAEMPGHGVEWAPQLLNVRDAQKREAWRE